MWNITWKYRQACTGTIHGMWTQEYHRTQDEDVRFELTKTLENEVIPQTQNGWPNRGIIKYGTVRKGRIENTQLGEVESFTWRCCDKAVEAGVLESTLTLHAQAQHSIFWRKESEVSAFAKTSTVTCLGRRHWPKRWLPTTSTPRRGQGGGYKVLGGRARVWDKGACCRRTSREFATQDPIFARAICFISRGVLK